MKDKWQASQGWFYETTIVSTLHSLPAASLVGDWINQPSGPVPETWEKISWLYLKSGCFFRRLGNLLKEWSYIIDVINSG